MMNIEAVLIATLFAERLRKIVKVFRIVATLALQVLVFWLLFKGGAFLYKKVDWRSLIAAHVSLSAFVLSVVVLIAGIAVFKWKLDAPTTYGFGEVSFGILSGFTLLLHIGRDYDPTRFMGTVGSIYIISRGLNNIKEGLEKAGLFDALWPLFPRSPLK